MKIKHIQKTTLIDYPGKIACTIFLFGCNFRCGFCHNPELVLKKKEENPDISKQEVLNFLEKRKNQLEGICITGGEPCLSLEKDFLKEIKNMGYKIKLDTNGSFPEKIKEFLEENLIDFVSMDVKSSFDKYHEITNSKIDIDKIKESIKIIHSHKNSDLKDYEFRTTILEDFHTAEEFREMVKNINEVLNGEKIERFALQGFRNSGKLIDESYYKKPNTTEKHLLKLKKIAELYCNNVEVRG